jgi:hypothetical protein
MNAACPSWDPLEEPSVKLEKGENRYQLKPARQVLSSEDRPKIAFTNSPVKKYERKSVFLADLADKRLRLNSPLPIHLEQAGDEVLGYSYDLDELEVADDEWSVIVKMRAAIASLYFVLKDEQAQLGPLMQQHWDFLRNIVSEN